MHTFIGTHCKSTKHDKELSTTKTKHSSKPLGVYSLQLSCITQRTPVKCYAEYLRCNCVIFKCKVHTRLGENKKYAKLDH